MDPKGRKIWVDGNDPIPVLVENAKAQLIGTEATDAYIETMDTIFEGFLRWKAKSTANPTEENLEALGSIFAVMLADFVMRNEDTLGAEPEATNVVIESFNAVLEIAGVSRGR